MKRKQIPPERGTVKKSRTKKQGKVCPRKENKLSKSWERKTSLVENVQ